MSSTNTRTAMEHLLADLRGRPVVVYSLGVEGRDLARWLLARGARVTMSDTRTAEQLAAAGAFPPPGVERTVVGQPFIEPDGFALVAVSQSVLRSDPVIARARSLGIPVVSQMQLLLRLATPRRVIGITGSSGKSTTTALVGEIARRSRPAVLVGGNLGEPLLERIETAPLQADVVLEISHTQLQYTDRSPSIAAVTNVTPNHLDQFTWDEYVDLKRRITAYQSAEDIAVLNADDPVTSGFAAGLPSTVWRVSTRGAIPGPGAWREYDAIAVRLADGRVERVLPVHALRLRGEHNVANAVTAAAIAAAAGYPTDAIAEVLSSFRGLPHRLQVVGTVRGVRYVDDSIATTPERTIAALRSFEEPIVLLLGGREKHLPLERLREEAGARCRAAVCFGEAGPLFAEALQDTVRTVLVPDLASAVERAAALARPGDTVLLSPAATSFDAYPNFAARGDAFAALVRALPGFEEAEA